MLANFGAKAAAALPGIIDAVVSWLVKAVSNGVGWVATNLWVLLVALGGLQLTAALNKMKK